MTVDPHTPCLVGTARRTWHPGEAAVPEPLEMWAELSEAAALDASAHSDVLGSIDDLSLVHCQSWAYDQPVDRLAQRLGIHVDQRSESILAGTSPQRLINAAAARMLRGESNVALVVGGEALATKRAFDRAGETAPWSHPHAAPPELPIALEEWYLPTEIAHGVLPAWLTFALLEQARWAARSGGDPCRTELRRVIGNLRGVADTNPDAWFRESATANELVTPSASNRLVANPYTKQMTAFMDVDMAAANLLVTKELADRWSVPDEQRVYLRGWGFARDAVHVAGRSRLDSSPAMALASAQALAGAGLGIEDIDLFDLYSCFASAVEFATDALGIAPDDHRPLSVTGGLPYHGGPSSNYMSHSISHVTSRLRTGEAETALVTGVGMHMTKHVAAVWSRTPATIQAWTPPDSQRWSDADERGAGRVAEHVDGRGTLVAATALHDRSGAPDHVIGICDLSDTARCYIRSDDPALLAAVVDDQWCGRTVIIERAGDATNTARLR